MVPGTHRTHLSRSASYSTAARGMILLLPLWMSELDGLGMQYAGALGVYMCIVFSVLAAFSCLPPCALSLYRMRGRASAPGRLQLLPLAPTDNESSDEEGAHRPPPEPPPRLRLA